MMTLPLSWYVTRFFGYAIAAFVAVCTFLAVVAVSGKMVEDYVEHLEQRDLCQQRAQTPYEYHRC